MRMLTIAAAVALLAASFTSFLPWHAADAPLGAISPYELTLAAPAMAPGAAPDAF